MSRLVALLMVSGLVAFASADARAADPSIVTKLERSRVFLGDAVRYTVELRNVENGDEPTLDGFDDFDLRYLGASTSSQVVTRLVNGRRVVDAVMGVTHSYELTAHHAGELVIPAPKATIEGKEIVGSAERITVVAPQAQDFVKIRARVRRGGKFPLQPFTIELQVLVKRLPSPYEGDDPLAYLDQLPRLSVPWADVPDGTEPVRETRDWVSPYLARQDGFERAVGFTMNDFTLRGNSLFSIMDRPQLAVFDLDAKVADDAAVEGVAALSGREEEFYVYTLERRFVPLRAGTLELGASSVKGSFIVDVVDRRGVMKEVFVRGEPVLVEIDDAPEEGRPPSFSGAFGRDFRVRSSVNPPRARVGDPLELVVEITGQGNVAEVGAPDLLADEAFATAFKVEDPRVDRNGSTLTATYSIRANSGEVAHVPPVRFSWFDLDDEQYEVTNSAPIPLEIEEISALGATDIVQYGDDPRRRGDLTRAEGLFGNLVDARAVGDDRVDGRWILAAPPTLLGLYAVLALFIAGHRRRTGDPLRARRRRAAGKVTARLEDARAKLDAGDRDGAAEAFSGALRGLVADAAGIPEAGLTTRDAAPHLAAASVAPELIDRVTNALEAIDGLRYGGGGATVSDEAGAVAKELLASLKKSRGVS